MAAVYEQPADAEKRVRFFDGQYLQDQDFVDEQHYHIDRRRRHNRTLHVAGIADGLIVTTVPGTPQVTVSPGTAIDADGRQIVLLEEPADERTVNLADSLGRTVNLYISYREVESDPQATGGADYGRWLERPQLHVLDVEATHDFATPPVLLARIVLNNQGIETIDGSVRQYSGLRLPGPAADAPTLRTAATGLVGLGGSLTVDGHVGIGTTDPQSSLHISSAGSVDILLEADTDNRGEGHQPSLTFSQDGGQVKAQVGYLDSENAFTINNVYNDALHLGTNNTKRLTILNNGQVGIGTTNPETKLEVSGGKLQLDGNQQIIFTNTDTSNNLKLQLWSGYGLGINGSTLFYAANGRHSWRDASGATERMALTTAANGGLTVLGTGHSSFAGNVGIGTTAPGAKLEVVGAIRVTGAIVSPEGTIRDDGGGWVRTYGDTGWCSQTHGGGWYMADTTWIRSYGSKNIYHNAGILRTDGTLQVGPNGNRFLVDSDGNVGIGRTAPGEKLEVNGNIKLSGWGKRVELIEASTASGVIAWGSIEAESYTGLVLGFPVGAFGGKLKIGTLKSDSSREFNELVRVTASGNVGIGTTEPKDRLDVHGVLRFNGNTATRIFGDARAGRNTLVLRGNWNELEVKGRVIDWTGSNLHIGYDNDHSGNYIELGRKVGHIRFLSGGGTTETMRITGGNVGIGTSNPTKAKVEINGSRRSAIGGYGWLNSSGRTSTAGSQNASYSLYANQRIAASEFNAHSDARIKHILGSSDGKKDLKTLLRLEVTDYTFIDTLAKGNQQQKRLIGQQVRDVYPQAVSILTDTVPDIYQLAAVNDGWIDLATHLSAGERVQLIIDGKTDVYEVLEASNKGFRVDLPEAGKVFVYGREVEDFHLIDYEAISMLNVSATQHLHEVMQEQQQALQKVLKQNVRLQEVVAQLQEKVESQTRR